jgi:hypothetical protein
MIERCTDILEDLDISDLLKAKELLEGKVNTYLEREKKHIKQTNIAKMQDDGDIPEELQMSAYADKDGKNKYLKGKRVRPLNKKPKSREASVAQQHWNEWRKEDKDEREHDEFNEEE